VVDDTRIHLRPPMSQRSVQRIAAVETMSAGLLGIASRMLFDRLAHIVQVAAPRCHGVAEPEVACILARNAAVRDETEIVAGKPVEAVDRIAVVGDSMIAGVHSAAVVGQSCTVAVVRTEVEAQHVALVGYKDGVVASRVVQAVDSSAQAEGTAVGVNNTVSMAHSNLLVG